MNFDAVGKENVQSIATIQVETPKKIALDVKEPTKTLAQTIKEAEALEPLLRENPNRFVLFPLRYHEVKSRPGTR